MRKILLCAAIAAAAVMGSPASSFAQRVGLGARIGSWLGGYGGYGGYGGIGSGAWLNQGLGVNSGYGNLYGRGYGSYYGSPYGYGNYWGSPYYGSPYYGSTYYGGYYSNPYYGTSYGFQPSYNYGQQMTYGQQMGYGQQTGASSSGYTPSGQQQPEFAHPQAVNLQVMVPPDATLWIEGQKVDATGPVRLFYSSPLKEGQTYTYHLKARWTDENGQPVERTKTFDVHAGARMAVNFMQQDQGQGNQGDLDRRNLNERQDRDLNRQDQNPPRKDSDLNRKIEDPNRKDK